jgi:hypothetical protein
VGLSTSKTGDRFFTGQIGEENYISPNFTSLTNIRNRQKIYDSTSIWDLTDICHLKNIFFYLI